MKCYVSDVSVKMFNGNGYMSPLLLGCSTIFNQREAAMCRKASSLPERKKKKKSPLLKIAAGSGS